MFAPAARRAVARRITIVAFAIAALPLLANRVHAQPAPTANMAAGTGEAADFPNSASAVVLAGQVNADNTLVRSGPSENDYPVMKVNAGALLNVVGSQGDWLKVEPPAGAFCLVSQAVVDKSGDGSSGKIILSSATVRVGSAIVPQKMTRHPIQLAPGATVKIIGEMPGSEWYKIEPPPGVYLYVQKQFVTPMQRVGEQPNTGGGVHSPGGTTPPGGTPLVNGDPATGTQLTAGGTTANNGAGFSTPPTTNNTNRLDPNDRFKVVSADRDAINGGVSVPLAAPATQPVDVTAIRALQEKLGQLEQQYVAASNKPLADQPLDELISGYDALLADQNLPPNARHVAEVRSQAVKLRKETLASAKETLANQEKAAAHQRELEAEQKELAERVAANAVKRYTAIGRLSQSSLQVDGQPLYRLIDPGTNRTIIYVRTPAGEDAKAVVIANGLNQFVAINGQVINDESKRMTYVLPKAYDVVDPKLVNTRLFADFSPPSLTATNVATGAGTDSAQ